tara:strand:- start:445 stop:1401 length:957 start_codon:yes stop_codon:yes gene_type:complete
MIRYSLSDFNQVLNDGLINELPEDTVNIINALAGQVGAPEYIKTPQFRNNKMLTSNNNNIVRRRKKFLDIDDTEWESIRSFQTTELKKKEGIECNLFTIRKYLNMMTFNTYDKLKDNIFSEINCVSSTKTLNDLQYICRSIYDIITTNILYSDIYAKLYKDLDSNFSIFKKILFENLNEFEEKFKNIEYYDPEEDYDKFCETNKKNEILRATCTFYINLMKENIIDKLEIYKIIMTAFTTLNNMISSGTKKNELDELSELIYIMVVNSYDIIRNEYSNYGEEILNNTMQITKLKIKDAPGVTNKCIFKHMDILDEISN